MISVRELHSLRCLSAGFRSIFKRTRDWRRSRADATRLFLLLSDNMLRRFSLGFPTQQQGFVNATDIVIPESR